MMSAMFELSMRAKIRAATSATSCGVRPASATDRAPRPRAALAMLVAEWTCVVIAVCPGARYQLVTGRLKGEPMRRERYVVSVARRRRSWIAAAVATVSSFNGRDKEQGAAVALFRHD